MKNNEYQCALCGEVFEKIWTQEEAIEEFKNNFGKDDIEGCVELCDDCYKIVMEQISN